MSDTQTAERTYKTVNGKTTQGNLRFVNPKKLADEGTTGVVAQGIYQGTVPNSFEPTRNDFKVLEDNGDTVILNANGSLTSQMKKVEEGSYVRISYAGKQLITKGKLKGKSVHNFIVEIAE